MLDFCFWSFVVLAVSCLCTGVGLLISKVIFYFREGLIRREISREMEAEYLRAREGRIAQRSIDRLRRRLRWFGFFSGGMIIVIVLSRVFVVWRICVNINKKSKDWNPDNRI